jgi:Predicted transcriptional regulators
MDIQIPTTLLDGVVLATLSREEMYGYSLTKAVQERLDISESTLYPVLRRLKKNGSLETYDVPFDGRMRRYYRITDFGKEELSHLLDDWEVFKRIIDSILKGEDNG